MQLKKMLLAGTVFFAFGCAVQAMAAEDCPGAEWVDYGKEVSGGACKDMGLDSHAGTCKSGHKYETLCDDRRGSDKQTQYKTCNGTKVCDEKGKEEVWKP
jgi:hypothetical protein